jgi:hypothetical protein
MLVEGTYLRKIYYTNLIDTSFIGVGALVLLLSREHVLQLSRNSTTG